MRLGAGNLTNTSFWNGIGRKVLEYKIHPLYISPLPYHDVALAIADAYIEFTDYVRPVCLPFQPIDEEDYWAGQFVTLAGWGLQVANDFKNINSQQLKIMSMQVDCRSSPKLKMLLIKKQTMRYVWWAEKIC